MRRLRISHVIVQPVLVWDDGEEMTTGPPIQPVQLTVSGLHAFADQLPIEVARIEAEAARQQPTPTAAGDVKAAPAS